MSKSQGLLIAIIILLLIIPISMAGCNATVPNDSDTPAATITPDHLATGSTQTITSQVPPTPLNTPSQTSSPTMTASPTGTHTPTITSTFTPSSSPTATPSPSITPTYAILRGTVLEQSNCRYGPGAAYLYKYGLYAGNNLEIIGRNQPGSWIVVQAIGGTNPCWVNASLLDIRGDVMSLAPTSLPLPQSPYYAPLTGVSAVRNGNTVIISWNPLVLRPGDDSLQVPYLVEAWLCQDGQLVFSPIGSWETMVIVEDTPGCSEPSHARVYGVEKHGYTAWTLVPWPSP